MAAGTPVKDVCNLFLLAAYGGFLIVCWLEVGGCATNFQPAHKSLMYMIGYKQKTPGSLYIEEIDGMEKILLVEDEYELAQAVAQELESAGYRVLRAADGESALRMHANQKPDVVILDWMLPQLNGLEVLRRLRQHAATPVLMLTARGEEADRVLGLELGADDYLVKPFSMRELIARIRALLRRSELLRQIVANDQAGTHTPLCYSTIYLDAQKHSISIDKQPVELSPHEFTLLSLLMRNPGRTFHRSYLLDTVWGNDYEGTERTVDTAIVRLRKKLGPEGEAIETVWGIGYRLKPERKSP